MISLLSKNKSFISPEQTELINAYGPYNHAIWTANEVNVSNEEQLSGRAEFLAQSIRKSILECFAESEIQTLSILDVGCYDGWILHQLSDLPFARMVGIEPRRKNIIKGQKIREILNIKTRAEFKVGDINSIEEKFDVVICVGLLHHLEITALALRRLKAICRRMIFIETICLSSKHITRAVARELELKDIVYFNKEKICGLIGQKFESSYYDGSAISLSIVSVPTIESLKMHMNMYGFEGIKIVVSPRAYRAAVWKNKRPFNAVCISALAGLDEKRLNARESTLIQSYERGLIETVMEEKYIRPLYERICLRKRTPIFNPFCLNALLYIFKYLPANLCVSFAKVWFRDIYELEIFKNLKFNSENKLSYEFAKIMFDQGKHELAIKILKGITQKLNADWRCIYRSFYLLHLIYDKEHLKIESDRYKMLCLTSNPSFPLESLKDGKGISSIKDKN